MFIHIYLLLLHVSALVGHLQVEYTINCWKLLHLQWIHFIWSGPFFALVEKKTTWLRIACHHCQSVIVCSMLNIPICHQFSQINLTFWWVAHNQTVAFTCSSHNTVTRLQWCTFREHNLEMARSGFLKLSIYFWPIIQCQSQVFAASHSFLSDITALPSQETIQLINSVYYSLVQTSSFWIYW
jgi:hypothetical protein